MPVLDAAKERELVIRTHVQFEWTEAGPSPVVDALAVLPVAIAARLPVALEHRTRVIGERTELRVAEHCCTEASNDRESCNPLPLRAPRSHRSSSGRLSLQRHRRFAGVAKPYSSGQLRRDARVCCFR